MSDVEILFVDDDVAILDMVDRYLTGEGYQVITVDSGSKALEILEKREIEIVFTDFKMPEISGLELLAAIKEFRPETEVIIVTGHGTMESVIQAMKIGSYDYLQKPFKLGILKLIINRIVEEKKLKDENALIKTRTKERHKYDALVGLNLKMQEIYGIIDRIKTNSPNVLISGESGTGKELTANVIHRNSDRSKNPLISIHCQSILKDVSEDSLTERLNNLLISAKNSALYLDDIAKIALPVQIELIKLFENEEKDSNVQTGYNVRLIGATDRDIKELVAKGAIHKDFFNLLNRITINIPPLRERKEDVCLLIHHFISRFNTDSKKQILNVSMEALDLLLDYHWPGNVIQLENVIERAFAIGTGLTININDLPEEIITFGEISKIS